jgi:hypothetical protein
MVQPESLDCLRIRSGVIFRPGNQDNGIRLYHDLFLVCYLSLASWAILGDKVSMLLRSRQRIRTFNLLMGSSLIVTAGYMLCLPFLNHS